jgi:hypothetical protein
LCQVCGITVIDPTRYLHTKITNDSDEGTGNRDQHAAADGEERRSTIQLRTKMGEVEIWLQHVKKTFFFILVHVVKRPVAPKIFLAILVKLEQ